MSIRKLEILSGVDDDKRRLLSKISRSIGQLGNPSYRKNAPRKLNQFEVKKRSALKSLYHQVDVAKDAATLKMIEDQLTVLLKPVRH